VGTIFQGSHLPLAVWLTAINLATLSPTSSTALARELAIKQGAAWYLLRALRIGASLPTFGSTLGGAERQGQFVRPVPAPKPSLDIYRVGYQPKFHLPMSFEHALVQYLTVAREDVRRARDQFDLAVRRVATNRRRLLVLPIDGVLHEDIDLATICRDIGCRVH
jgi:hypothetical protein